MFESTPEITASIYKAYSANRLQVCPCNPNISAELVAENSESLEALKTFVSQIEIVITSNWTSFNSNPPPLNFK